MRRLFGVVGLVLLLASAGTTNVSTGAKSPITVDVQPTVQVLAAPCGSRPMDITIGNTSTVGVYADVFIVPSAPVRTSHDLISTYVPPQESVVVRTQVSAPSDALGGTYSVVARSGTSGPSDSSAVTVVERPGGPSRNLAFGGPVSASSTHGNFTVCGAADGNRSSDDWSTSTGWNDGTSRVFPDWYAASFAQPESVSRVVVYTLGSTRYPSAQFGLRDWDVQVLEGSTWRTVASVRGNTSATVTSTFTPVVTSSVRILALASNDANYSRIVELEIYT
jgi:hypothetical protein